MDPILNTVCNSSPIVVPRVRCRGNVFIGRSLAMAVSSGSTVPVFQLSYYKINSVSMEVEYQLFKNSEARHCRGLSLRILCVRVCEKAAEYRVSKIKVLNKI
jgi:hypothetical protein